MRKYTEKDVPSSLRLRVRYITRLRGGMEDLPKWQTQARLLDRETNTLVAMGIAECGDKDTPSKKIGRAIAIGRALLEYNILIQEEECDTLIQKEWING